METPEDHFEWETILQPIFYPNASKNNNYAVILLNHCFDNILVREKSEKSFFDSGKFKRFQSLWNGGKIRISVDGGTNTLYNFQQSILNNNFLDLKDPTFITGDFDSIRMEVMEHFKQKNEVQIRNTPDQDHTDFTKSVFVLKENILQSDQALSSIFVFYTNFGRIDQYLSILSTVHDFNEDKSVPPIILVDMIDSISFVLNKGSHRIPRISKAKWCSLMPLCGPVILSTKGFRWNLESNQLEFGKFVSSSNEFDSDSQFVTVHIEQKRQLLFSSDFSF